MEGFDKHDELNEEMDGRFRQEIYSKAVRAGKRTYFFDVKSTKSDELYLTVTESKKRFEQDGKYHYEKHKIFLYKEDFEKFSVGLAEVVDFILQNQPEGIAERVPVVEEENFDSYEAPKSTVIIDEDEEVEEVEEEMVKSYTNVEFDDI